MAVAWLAVATCLAAQAQTTAATADTLIVKRVTQLRESPTESAPALAPLAAKTQVTRLVARRGPWIEVRTVEGVTGWVHMFDVGTTPVAQGGNFATGALRGLTGLFGGGNSLAPNRTPTATIGIRGLGAEDITNTQPNPQAVTLAEALRVDATQARQFGTVAALASQVVEPLPVPPRPQQPAGPNTGAAPAGSQR
ncbi:MAG: SH3 domain-containing protein [Betaproteobacteria bacterium]